MSKTYIITVNIPGGVFLSKHIPSDDLRDDRGGLTEESVTERLEKGLDELFILAGISTGVKDVVEELYSEWVSGRHPEIAIGDSVCITFGIAELEPCSGTDADVILSRAGFNKVGSKSRDRLCAAVEERIKELYAKSYASLNEAALYCKKTTSDIMLATIEARCEAKKLTDDASAEADKILAEARAESDRIVAGASDRNRVLKEVWETLDGVFRKQ